MISPVPRKPLMNQGLQPVWMQASSVGSAQSQQKRSQKSAHFRRLLLRPRTPTGLDASFFSGLGTVTTEEKPEERTLQKAASQTKDLNVEEDEDEELPKIKRKSGRTETTKSMRSDKKEKTN